MRWLAIFVFLLSVYTTKRELSRGDQKLIVTPVPVILMNTYTDGWINKNIDLDGSMK